MRNRSVYQCNLTQGINAYLNAKPRAKSTQRRLNRIAKTVNTDALILDDVNQNTVGSITSLMWANKLTPEPTTVEREVTVPLRAVVRYCETQNMCRAGHFLGSGYVPDAPRFFYPDEAELLVKHAAPHIQPLLIFLFGTGARMSEALYLDWKDVALASHRVIFQANRTKAKKRRVVIIPPRVELALLGLPHRTGPVFLTHEGKPYEPRDDQGGQIIAAWEGAMNRAGMGLRAELTPHSCRHSWATWHHCVHKNLLKLKQDGGWGSVTIVERYAHVIDDRAWGRIFVFLGIDANDPIGLGFERTQFQVGSGIHRQHEVAA